MPRILLRSESPAALFHTPELIQAMKEAGFDVSVACADGIFSDTAIQTMSGNAPANDEKGFDAVISPYANHKGALPCINTQLKSEFHCGAAGTFLLPSPEALTEAAISFFKKQDFANKTILLTAGPTIEDADPARFVSNRSTGRMGTAIARTAARRGANVLLVHGPMLAPIPQHEKIHSVPVRSASQMLTAVDECLPQTDIAILCAAVADFSPMAYSEEKIKKGKSEIFTLQMRKNPDILAHIGAMPNKPFLVGFAAESNNVEANAQDKLLRKNCDILCANDITAPNCGFATSTNSLTVFRRNAPTILIPLASKDAVADSLLDIISKANADCTGHG